MDKPVNQRPEIIAERNQKPAWHTFPDSLPNGEFRGYEVRKDQSMVRGAFVLGQNIKFRDSGQPTLREGFDTIGTEASDAYSVDRAWVFETRAGDVYELKVYNGELNYFLVGTSTEFALLKSGYTAGHEFGYGNIGESEGEFHTMFCNGVEPWAEWNGAHAIIASVTANTITKSGATGWSALDVPFYTTGTRKIIIDGTEFTYTGGEGTDTLTGVTPNPVTAGITAGMLAVQAPRTPTWHIFLPFSQVASGAFQQGETVTGGTSGKTATVVWVGPDGTYITISAPSGTFTDGETLTGGTSSATGILNFHVDQTLGPPLSSVISSHLSRLHCRSEVKKSSWWFSTLDDPYCWSVFNGDTSGGRKDLDFGGPITAFGRITQTILAYKKRGIVGLNFVSGGSRLDNPVYTPLIQSDDKGTTLGAIGQRSTFTSPYGVISITEDSKMILLSGITNNDQPDYVIISDPIQPIFTMGVHTDACGICVDGVLWYGFKSSASAGMNDTVLTGDLRRRTVDAYGNTIPLRWDTPSIGWLVNDWTAVPDPLGGVLVHWHSSQSSNSYTENPDDKVDNGGGFTASLRTWSEFFGAPGVRKRADKAYVEILLRENSIVNATLLMDEEGSTGSIEKVMRGDRLSNRFGWTIFNPIGASVFGSERIGSNGSIDDRKRYRFYFELKPSLWFFNLALSLVADTENSDFELIRFGIHITEYEIIVDKKLAI
jgi:hypothetical protein